MRVLLPVVGLAVLCFCAFNKGQRIKILERDGYRCRDCGRTWEDGWMLVVHHMKPRSAGGKDEEWNGQTLCRECHREAHMRLFKRAKRRGDKKDMNRNARAVRLIDKEIRQKGLRRYGH